MAAALILVALALAADERPFDWDRYNARQDAGREADRIFRYGRPSTPARTLGRWVKGGHE
jgi:hypothetical protein